MIGYVAQNVTLATRRVRRTPRSRTSAPSTPRTAATVYVTAGPHDRHNVPEVVASVGRGDHYLREVVPILRAPCGQLRNRARHRPVPPRRTATPRSAAGRAAVPP